MAKDQDYFGGSAAKRNPMTTANLGGAGNVSATAGAIGSGFRDSGLGTGYSYGLPTELAANKYQMAGRTPKGGGNVFDDSRNKQDSQLFQQYGGGAGYGYQDADVRRMQELQNALANGISGLDQGVDQGALAAQIKALQARIGLKNELGSAIATNPEEMGQSVQNQRELANEALSSGIHKTRQNYNSRGLLYSGLREGGEQGIKGKVGSSLASNIASTKRDYQNTLASEKAAYTSLGFAQQAADLERANQAFEVTTRNNIARAQAYEQLGYGVGSLAGYATTKNAQPAAPMQPQQTQATESTNSYWSNNPYSTSGGRP